jgi:crotonobetainyl-CoA:carnitine CoA-transferase CaiB-like acyl-CoA transferase
MAATPLSNLRVIDLTRARSGPNCVKYFGDFGADVIRIERPDGSGDPLGDDRDSADYVNAQRNKRGIAIDLKRPEGVDVLKRAWSPRRTCSLRTSVRP